MDADKNGAGLGLPDDVWTRLNIEFSKDAADAVFKALVE
jgi:ATP-dependent Lon protease